MTSKRKTTAEFFGKGIHCRHHAKYRKTCAWCDFETWWHFCIRHINGKENFMRWRKMIGKNW